MDKTVEDVYNWKYTSQTHKCPKCGHSFHTNSTLRRHANNCNGFNVYLAKPNNDDGNPLKTEPESQEPDEVLAIHEHDERLQPPLKKAKKEINNNNANNSANQNNNDDEQQEGGGLEIPTKTVQTNEEALLKTKAKRKNNGLLEKSFKCSFCIYSTSLRHNLERHIRGHTELKNYKCPYCSFSSNGRNIIKAHVSSYHSIEGEKDPIEISQSIEINRSVEINQSIEINQSTEINQSIEQNLTNPSISFQSTLNESQEEVKTSDESVEEQSAGLEAAALTHNSMHLATIDKSLDEPKESKQLKDDDDNGTGDNDLVNLLNLVSNVHRNDNKPKWTLRAFREVNKLSKYSCPDCPFKSNGLDQYRSHAKNHRIINSNRTHYKCPYCSFSSVKVAVRDNHLKLHKNERFEDSLSGSDKALVPSSPPANICRCDLADEVGYPDLACYKQMICPCCTVRSPSVTFLRCHVACHTDLVLASRFKIFDPRLDAADSLLKFCCLKPQITTPINFFQLKQDIVNN